MDKAGSTYFILSAVFVGAMVVFSLGLLFVRAARMERNVLVGVCTLITTLIACYILDTHASISSDFTVGQMASIILLCLLGFGLGWFIDRMVGAKRLANRDRREATLGAELAD